MTFILLEITSLLSKKKKVLWRIILSSILGALYSLIIFVDNVPYLLIFLSKFVSSLIIVAVGFRFYSLLQYIKCVFIFYFSSILLLGVAIALCYIFNFGFIAINNSVMYFNISAPAIIFSGVLAYFISSMIIKFYNRSLSKKEIYTLIIEHNGNQYNMFAFLDTGNKLREPFSNQPVIIVNSKSLNIDLSKENTRLIPVNTVTSSNMLIAFKPDKIMLKSSNGYEVIENAYIALCEDIGSKNYSAILNYDILSI